MVVDLPAPFGPMYPTNSPGCTPKDTPPSASTLDFSRGENRCFPRLRTTKRTQSFSTEMISSILYPFRLEYVRRLATRPPPMRRGNKNGRVGQPVRLHLM